MEILEKYPDLRALLYEYVTLADVLIEQPWVAPFLSEYHDLINSLLETGRRNVIDNGGVAYINTGIYATKAHGIEAHINHYNAVPNAKRIFGAENSFNIQIGNNRFYFNTTPINRQTYAGYLSYYADNDIIWFNFKESKIANHSTYRPDAYKTALTLDDGVCENPLGVFAFGDGSGVANMRYNYFKISEGQDIIMNLVPFKRSTGECGMLDLVSLKFFGNANTTGSFTIVTEDK